MKAVILLVLLNTSLLFGQDEGNDEDAVIILDKIDSLYLSQSAHSKIKLTVSRPDFTWHYDLEWHSRGRNNVFVRIHSPLDHKGQGVLKVGKEMWFYNPKEERVRQISRTGALRRFLKSEFSRDDFLKINRLSEEYNVNMQEVGENLKLILTPKMVTPIVWDKIVFELNKETHLPISKSYYNERGAIAKRILYSKPTDINGVEIPTVLDIVSFQYKGYKSRIEFLEINLDGPIKPHIFSMKHLRNLIGSQP